MTAGLIIDSFAGGGGASTGIEWTLGRSPDIAINHDADALAMHAANHPGSLHLTENIWKVDPLAVTGGKPVFLLWASPDCRHHSKAKGGVPVSRSVRGLADVVLVWAETVHPQVICLENVEEFAQWGPLDEDGRPCPYHKGKEFARWVRALETQGYAVEWRERRAYERGAPTIRKRLYVVARRDGKPIIWLDPTHGRDGTYTAPVEWMPPEQRPKGKLARWRTAAEIIDWTLPCPSIFLTKSQAKADGLNIIRPLADRTLARIARGFKRHVLDRAEPFVVRTDMTSAAARNGVHAVDEPIRTITTAGSFAAVQPFVATLNHAGEEFRGQSLDDPFRTVTSSRDAHGLITPFVSHAQQGGRSRPAADPLHTVTASTKDQNQIIAPMLAVNRFDSAGQPIDVPMPTITANSFLKRPGAGGPLSVLTGYLVPRYGERPGQEPRSRGLEEPAPVVVPTGNGGDLAAVYLAQQNTDMIGHDADKPLSTIVGKASTQTPVMGYLATLQNNAIGQDLERPLGTIMTSGAHHAFVAPFVTSYYTEGGQDSAADAPLPTVPTRDRFSPIAGLIAPALTPEMAARAREVAAFLRAHGAWDGAGEFVTIGDLIVWDIGMRMLTPRELARAQGFPDSYILAAPRPGGGVLTETAQRHKIGNSVSPYEAADLVYANCVLALEMPSVKRRQRARVPTWPGYPPGYGQQQPSFLQAAG